MRHKSTLITLVALVAAVTCALSVNAYDFKYGDFYYKLVNDSIVEVTYNTGFNTYSGNVTIPEWVIYSGKSYTVGGIGALAFYQCSSLISVTIPNSVTYIAGQAFNYCGSLVRVTMGKNCDFYNEYTWADALNAFANCPNLTYITCWNKNPRSFREDDEAPNFMQTVFNNAILYVPRGSEATYRSLEGWRLFSHIQEIPTDYNFDFCVNGIYYKYRSGTSNAVKVAYRDEDYNSYSGSVTVPATVTYNGTSYNVTAIDDYAFAYCSNLWTVSLPASLDSIGRYAFINCTGLSQVEIPNTVTEMGNGVFQGCSALKFVQFPANLTVINASMCRNCTALETLIIPSKVTSIYVSAFSNCTALKQVICFPASVPSMNYSSTFPSEAYNNATLYTIDGAQGYTSPNSYFNNFTTKKPYSELLDAALNTTGGTIHFTSTGDYPWLIKGSGSSAYAQSGNKSLPSSSSSLTAEVTVPAGGTLYFDFKAWGEGTTTFWDKCSFYVNGVLQTSYGAYQNASWETYAVTLPSGTSTLEWRYTKDSSVNPTGDYFAIDNVRYTASEAYACYTPENTTLTFYYDALRSSRTGTTYDLNTGNNLPAWRDDGTNANVTKAVFNSSFANARPKTTCGWFAEMANLQTITGMAYLNTCEVTNMRWMFGGCSALTSLDVSNLNTAQVTNMVSMFDRCILLTSLDLSHFNTAKVTDMSQMFYECNNLTSLNVSNFNTANVTNMSLMFNDCKSLTSLDLSSFNTAKVAYMSWMLGGCGALRTIYVGDGWTTAAVQYSTNMFLDSYNLVGGKGTTYDSNHIDAAYAHIDGGSSNPGYFTKFVSLDEALNVAGGNIHFVSTGSYPWTAVQEGSRVYAQSGNAGVKSSVSVMTATVTVDEATTLSFDFKAWGESNSTGIFDYCAFFVDNDELIYYGARDNDWERFTVELSAGTHTLKWMYSKDSIVDPDGDYFAIDNVAIGSGGLLGDVNGDGRVDVGDVTALISKVLGNAVNPFNADNADINGDNRLDVSDVTALIAMVLNS